MIGASPAFCHMIELLRRMASYDATVLIEGETGTGKELAARAIHYQSGRRHHAFLPINCGALQDSLIENELFGHCRGAFTDARQDQAGLIDAANGGTLFLDEVDALSVKAQVTLLRFLEDRQYRPVGGRTLRNADVRVLAASNRCLESLMERGHFRADLLYRLRIMRLAIPPLRERAGDVALLAEHFVLEAARRFGKPALPLSPRTLAWLDAHRWPGNVRELENTVCQAFLLADGDAIDIETPAPGAAAPADPPRDGWNYRRAKLQALILFERQFLRRAIDHAGGNVSEAARLIGTERRHLGRLLKKHGFVRALPQA